LQNQSPLQFFSQGKKVSYTLQFEEYKLGVPAKYVTTAVLVDNLNIYVSKVKYLKILTLNIGCEGWVGQRIPV